MKFLYTATETFDERNDDEELGWAMYVQWSQLTHLTELVSLDGHVNKFLVAPDFTNGDDYNYIHTDDTIITGFYTSIDYVSRKKDDRNYFNLLTLVIEPEQVCNDIAVEGYKFMGYELLDVECGISVLTNCGDLFSKTFLPEVTNQYGLIDSFEQAKDIQRRLLADYPDQHHALAKVIAVWRHSTIGR